MKKIVVIVLLLAYSLVAGQKGFVADKSEHDMICGLKPYQYPKWTTEIELSNARKLHFVSVKCMMLFYFKNDQWADLGVKGKEDIKDLRVQDYNTLDVVDAKEAFYVFGSRRISPKGDDLVPFATEQGAKEFIEKDGGKRIMRFNDFKLNLMDFLNL